VRIGVLGPTEAWVGSTPVDLGARKQRALLAALVLHRGRAVPVDTLVDLLWGDHPPAGMAGTLQVYVAGLRRALEPDRPARAPASILVTVGAGYALRLPEPDVDVAAFERTVDAVHRGLGAGRLLDAPRLTEEELAGHLDDLTAALATWRAAPFLDLDDAPDVRAERARLEELHAVALEDRAAVGLALGRHATVAAELEALTAANPLRERLWAQRAVALARSGRQADALETLRRVRDVLADELGLEPGPELREIQAAVLRQDPALEWQAPQVVTEDKDRERAAPSTQPPWPLVGRSAEVQALRAVLDQARAGRASFVALVGEPGIGKTRLCAELAAAASESGVWVVSGRCSQDEGAPPLWPWRQVLRGLGRELEVPPGHDEGAQFRTWESLVDAIVTHARSEPLVVVVDDLHWADVSSLRVLRLLVDTAEDARLLVVATWRSFPPPEGALADVAESLARRHALRLDLGGLDASGTAAVVGAVTDYVPSATEAAALRERTDGNPFFLVEYARLARDRGDLKGTLAEADPPSAVHDVLVRRLDRLPRETHELVRVAAVCGREFDLETIAAAANVDEDTALDRIEPAVSLGLVREEGVGRFLFGHALVRDTAYGGLPPTRRARLHGRVAALLDARAGRESEAARHWLAAGPEHAPRAWRAAAAAAGAAAALHAHEQAADLLTSALTAVALDPAASARDRYELLMARAEAYRWSAHWVGLRENVEAAIAVADTMDDLELVARAASAMMVGALWQSAPYGTTHPVVVAALRRCVTGLPPEDSELRCRVMLGLANELYYAAHFEERTALVEQALAMARRLRNDSLLLEANLVAFVSLWCPRTSAVRKGYATEALELARRAGDERAQVLAGSLKAASHGERGEVEQMWEAASTARAQATRLRVPYGLMLLEALELPWLAMAGRFDQAEGRLERLGTLLERMSVPQNHATLVGATISLRLWQGRGAELAAALDGLAEDPLPVISTIAAVLVRSGRVEAARELVARHPVQIQLDDWMSLLVWGTAAEIGAWLGDRALAAAAYEKLSPYAGMVASAGSASHMGPVDAFLALAAAGVGETHLATRHADDADRQFREWRIPLAAKWFRDQRDHWGI
jgi:DNA-binding SARP family transcriptional activator